MLVDHCPHGIYITWLIVRIPIVNDMGIQPLAAHDVMGGTRYFSWRMWQFLSVSTQIFIFCRPLRSMPIEMNWSCIWTISLAQYCSLHSHVCGSFKRVKCGTISWGMCFVLCSRAYDCCGCCCCCSWLHQQVLDTAALSCAITSLAEVWADCPRPWWEVAKQKRLLADARRSHFDTSGMFAMHL